MPRLVEAGSMGLMVKGLHHRKPNLQSQLDAAVFSNCTIDPRTPSEGCFTRALAPAPSNAGFARSLAPLSPLKCGPLGQSPPPPHIKLHGTTSIIVCRSAVRQSALALAAPWRTNRSRAAQKHHTTRLTRRRTACAAAATCANANSRKARS